MANVLTDRIGFVLVALTTLIASTMACGGGGSGGTCAMGASCGGDIVGNWQVTSSCLKITGTLGESACPSATVNASLQATGTASYTAALSYTLSFTLTGTETVGFPASCLTNSGVTLTCEQLNQALAANPPDPSLVFHCSSAGGGGCNCATTLNPMTVAETGTYVTAGGTLTNTPSAGTPETDTYCVKGTQLDLSAPAVMSSPGITTTGFLTFSKQ